MNRPATGVDPLLEWRREFPSVERSLHFVSHSLGAMPRGVADALRDYADTWTSRGINAWEESWFTLPREVGDSIASIIGAPPGSVSMHENVTVAQSVALSAFDFEPPRNRVVCTAEDFPSVLYLYEGLVRRGAELVRVEPRAGRAVDEQDICAAIDERTALVAISHVLFRSSQVLDVARVIAAAQTNGARVMLDAYQAVGTVPVDVQALGVDMLTGGSIKWLCGGPGGSYLYVRPELAGELEPALTGWFAHRDPFAFDAGATVRDRGARRFWTGTTGIPSYVAARVGIEIVERIGVQAIREKSLRQTGRMIELADAFDLPLGSPREPERRGGSVVLDVAHAEAVCRALLGSGVTLDYRPGVGLRLAPHFYTRDDEVETVMQRVREEVEATAR